MSRPLKLILLFIGALVLALAARSLYISLSQAGQPSADSNAVVQIRIAAGQLPAGLLLRNEDLDWRAAPRSGVPAGAITEDSTAARDITGVMLRRDMKPGAPVLERDVIRPNAPGFLSAALKPGMRAVSVAVDNVSGNAGLIQPGDYVDMILVQETGGRGNMGFGFPESEAKARSVVSETVVEKARVIAVGSEFLQYQEESSARKDTGRNAARTVTLEVQPRAAEAIAVAARLGTITLALRSFARTERNGAHEDAGVTWEGEQDSDGPLWASDVSRAIAGAAARNGQAPVSNTGTQPVLSPQPAPAGPKREISIFRGSERSTQTLNSATNP
ncbi:Flp pilus assembly protein CpaB [Candidimonas sp. SYP-B2681]|uniref:Flp pilus assembly protein CpaB n=1 Tax=Candidimonas sp. SYP-B2681 TaxID=2497686 RepID=UPI000F891C50|nr:Flp pilus assembly protein CpaB [Candidimonas sp. SYP-B2681]RTZ45346.1 Flp pilus assembly protein CpaB [Candidimonas sp. SYP-B2681]